MKLRPHPRSRSATCYEWVGTKGLVPSLKMLIEEQEYSISDVGLMFGVSRERVRQWCVRFGIQQRGRNRGKNTRQWNEDKMQFEPKPCGAIAQATRRARS